MGEGKWFNGVLGLYLDSVRSSSTETSFLQSSRSCDRSTVSCSTEISALTTSAPISAPIEAEGSLETTNMDSSHVERTDEPKTKEPVESEKKEEGNIQEANKEQLQQLMDQREKLIELKNTIRKLASAVSSLRTARQALTAANNTHAKTVCEAKVGSETKKRDVVRGQLVGFLRHFPKDTQWGRAICELSKTAGNNEMSNKEHEAFNELTGQTCKAIFSDMNKQLALIKSLKQAGHPPPPKVKPSKEEAAAFQRHSAGNFRATQELSGDMLQRFDKALSS